MNQESGKRLLLPNNDTHAKAFRDIDNHKKYKIQDNGKVSLEEINIRKRFEAMTEAQTTSVKADTEEELLKILKRMSPSGQRGFLYIVGKAIERNYECDFFEVNINELFDVLGIDRQASNINRLVDYLRYLKEVSFRSKTPMFGKKNNTRKLDSYLITEIEQVMQGRKTLAVSVKLGSWITDLKKARKANSAILLTLSLDCLKVDTKRFPYAFGVPYRMAQHARTNARHKREWEILTLKEIIESVEPWEEAEKKLKKYGFNSERSFIEKLTQSLEHAEPHFKFRWQWKEKEPETIAEARNARIEFQFLEPLKKKKVTEPA